MNMPVAMRIECARGEIINAIESIRKQHDLPACIIDGVLSSTIAEVRSQAKIELINATNEMLQEKNEEIEKARKEAKKVLKDKMEQEETAHKEDLQG